MGNDPKTQKGPTGGRAEKGTPAERQEPHVTENAEEARVQEHHPSPEAVPTLPPNAQGVDKRTTDTAEQEIDEESMYDRRPTEDKDRPPSSSSNP